MTTLKSGAYSSFEDLAKDVHAAFRQAKIVRAPRWQGMDVSGKPDMETLELLNHTSTLWLPDEDLAQYRRDIRPDLPWADDHFEERVSGYPTNPGTQWAKWRLGKSAEGSLDPDGRFNHNYMERFWPKFARMVPKAEVPGVIPLGLFKRKGILYDYGDLRDVVGLLARDPMTRQAVLPMFFPEDTGNVHRGRAPCSLTWHFILRDGLLHCVYSLRSCDVTNHWRNDIYMAIRLMLWVLQELRAIAPDKWEDVTLGYLTTHITSFHCFRGEAHKL